MRAGWWVIFITVVASIFTLMIPLPEALQAWRPLLPLLVVLYWVLYSPDMIGVAGAWTVGLLTDFLYGLLLGPYALMFAICAYLVLRAQSRLKMYPLFQQACWMGLFVLGVQAVVLILQALLMQRSVQWMYLLPAVSSFMAWPFLEGLFNPLRQRFFKES